MKTWNQLFIEQAQLISTKSKDPSTQVGAILVGPDNEIRSAGYNDFPRGIDDSISERRERPTKYAWTEHAERNCIYNAARVGIPTKGCTLYLNFEPIPCTDCARAIIQSGIIEIIGPNIPFAKGKRKKWDLSLQTSKEMLEEVGITLTTVYDITEDTLNIK